jgi:amino acid adenylation domain-containing protein
MKSDSPLTLATLLAERADSQPDDLAYTFVRDDLTVAAQLTYRQLQERALRIAGQIVECAGAGERVLLAYGPGLEFICAFWACAYAGVVAVPIAINGNAKATHSRLSVIAQDAGASLVLSTARLRDTVIGQFSEQAETWKWIASDAVLKATPLEAAVRSCDLAYLQYTSGSTSTPKGVMVTHANVLANCAAICKAALHRESRMLTWLPHFHDYGLVHGILAPVCAGARAILMAPTTFVRRPLRWLEAIGTFRATHTGAPNFAYAACVQALEVRPDWSADLGSLVNAGCGAEPINPETITLFQDAFARFGFSNTVFAPAYGLAEATLGVTGKAVGTEARCLWVSDAALQSGRVELAVTHSPGSRALVSCGVPLASTEVVIANPESGIAAGTDRVGEIWIAGASVGAGYWGKPDLTREAFGATLGATGKAYLRTGDLGFLRDGELFVTGRLKDMLIVHGRNLYPQDIERTVERADAALRSGHGAAFGVDSPAGEQLVAVQEVRRDAENADLDAILQAIRQAVADYHELPIHAIVLVRAGSVPRTTSGKIQRRSCKQKFIDGEFEILRMSRPSLPAMQSGNSAPTITELRSEPDSQRRLAKLERFVAECVAKRAGQDLQTLSLEATLIEAGLDSLTTFQLLEDIQASLGIALPPSAVLNGTSLRGLAERLLERLEDAAAVEPPGGPDPAPAAALTDYEQGSTQHAPASAAQRNMWVAAGLAGPSAIYNLPYAVRIAGQLRVPELGRALQSLVERHAALRTAFEVEDGELRQVIHRRVDCTLPLVELGGRDANDRQGMLSRLLEEQAQQPFDLTRSPLWRACLYQVADAEHVLLLVVHHLVCDGWSHAILMQDLGAIYAALVAGKEQPAPGREVTYADYVLSPHGEPAEAQIRAQLDYWKSRLAGLQPTRLSADRPARPRHDAPGAVERFLIPAEQVAKLRQLGRADNSTLYMVLLAAFQTLLMRYTGKKNISVVSPAAARTRARYRSVVGLFSNTLVMRADLGGNPPFRGLLAQVRDTAVQAYAHQDVQADRLISELGLERSGGRNTLDPVCFALQSLPDSSLRLAGTQCVAWQPHTGAARCELSCTLYDAEGALRGELEFRTDLFERAAIQRLAKHFQTLLGAIVAAPDTPVADLQLLDDLERRGLLVEWRGVERSLPLEKCVPELFAERARLHPEAPAVMFGDRRLTYAELNRQANQLARFLRSQGVGPDRLVGICVTRSLELVVGLLGILKAGGAYVPLDPSYPAERLRHMLEDAAPQMVLTQEALRAVLPTTQAEIVALDTKLPEIAGNDAEDLPAAELRLNAQHLVYVIYTSGSTGRPKGIAMAHRSMVNLLQWHREQFGSSEGCRVLQFAALSFDVAFQEIFSTLCTGGSLVLLDEWVRRDAGALTQLLNTHAVARMFMPPLMLQSLAEHYSHTHALPASLRDVITAGEQLRISPEIVALFKRLDGCRLHNHYGPTETHVVTALTLQGEPQEWAALPAIGRPISNTQIYVLDEHRQPVPIGVPGEIYAGGAGVARGYLGKGELTAERFIANPFLEEPGRLYRTGDLGRWRADGTLEYLGRNDEQVKIRGYRIELGEIEALLAEHPQVKEAAVVAHADVAGQKRLVAYVTRRDSTEVGVEELRAHLKAMLPEYMVPSAYVTLERLPLTPSGKLDRGALPAPQPGAYERQYEAPQGEVEAALAEIWGQVLHVERVHRHDNFFDLGGHSLMATQVISRIRQGLQVELPLKDLFESPTIAGLAGLVAGQQALAQRLVEPAIEPVARTQPLPVSFSQRRMWLIQQLDTHSTAYNMPFALRLRGRLDQQTLLDSLQFLAERHEAFRTTFHLADGGPVQLVTPHAAAQVRMVDLRDLPEHIRDERAAQLFREESLRPFDLAVGPLFRFALVRLREAEHALLWLMHHSVGDQWSAGIVARELVTLYADFGRGVPPSLEPLPIQYADFATWQRHYLGGAALDGQLAYWREKLRGAPALSLPTDHQRPKRQTYRGSVVYDTLSPDTLASLKRFSAERGATAFMTLLACYKMLLARYTGQDDIAVGSPVANRTRVATENLVGTLVNTLVMRTSLAGDPTFSEFLVRVRETALEAFAHQDLPFERLVDELNVSHDTSHSPLVQVLFNVLNAPMGTLRLDGVDMTPFDFDHGSAQFDLSVSVETELFGRIALIYSTDLFEHATAQRMLSQYIQLVEQVIADPARHLKDYRLATDAERALMIREWNRTEQSYPEGSRTDELVAAQAQRTPRAIAVSIGARRLSYGALDARANQIAHYLRQLGVTSGARVGICLERSTDMLAALLAVMKTGAAYVPLDPAFPQDRLQFMAQDAGLSLTLTHQALLDTLPKLSGARICLEEVEHLVRQQPPASTGYVGLPDDIAYILYTSGSTGKPKGVAVPHRALTNFLCSMRNSPGCRPSDTLLSVTTLSFDISGLELYLPLIVGARVELAAREEVRDTELLIRRMAECRPTIMQATPATWRMLIDAGWDGDRELTILCGGETLTRDLADQLLERCGTLWNMYGPTETTIWSTLQKIERDARPISIGRPIANTTLYILDKTLQPTPVGVAGELFIGGHGVAAGYHDRDDLTMERFTSDPFRPATRERIYRTGDLARYLPDGRVVHLGRMDTQVKIRGFRIEPGEVESVLGRHPAVALAAVAAKSDHAGLQQLVGYVIPRAGERPSVEELRAFMQANLPAYMVPSHIIYLAQFPLTNNNKVDVKRLPELAPDLETVRIPRQPPGTQLEVQLMALWRSVLDTDDIGVNDNFFDLGGHSLKAAQLVGLIRQVFKCSLPLAALLQAPSVAQMARLLTESKWADSKRSLVAIQPRGSAVPIFAVPGVAGNALVFGKVARLLGPNQPFYGLEAQGLDGKAPPFTVVAQAAAHYIREIKSVRPQGPYLIAGTCTGGVFAYEIAQQLRASGAQVELIILETWPPFPRRTVRWTVAGLWPIRWAWLAGLRAIEALREKDLREWPAFFADKLRKLREPLTESLGDDSPSAIRVIEATTLAVARYQVLPYSGGLLNVIASRRPLAGSTFDMRRNWERSAQQPSRFAEIASEDSGQMFVSPHVEALAMHIAAYSRERFALTQEPTSVSRLEPALSYADSSTG